MACLIMMINYTVLMVIAFFLALAFIAVGAVLTYKDSHPKQPPGQVKFFHPKDDIYEQRH